MLLLDVGGERFAALPLADAVRVVLGLTFPEFVLDVLGFPGVALFHTLTRTLHEYISSTFHLQGLSRPPCDRQGSLLRLVRIGLVSHLLHSDLQPTVLRERHVLLLHVLLASVRHLLRPEVDLVADVASSADDEEQKDERNEVGEASHNDGAVVPKNGEARTALGDGDGACESERID